MAITKYTSTMNAWAATDAGFRAWGKTFTDMLDTLGLTQVYSNIDWTTVLMPTTVTYAGKRVYRLNDSVSGTREVYFALDFGRGHTSNASHGFAIKLTVGTTHDGAGNVTGYSMSESITCTQAPADGGDIIGVKSDSGFSVWTNINVANTVNQVGFAIERLCENGSPTPDGTVMMLAGQGNPTYSGTYAASALWRVANYAGGQVFTHQGCISAGAAGRGFANFQAVPDNVDPSYAGKAPAMMMDTFGKYDPCFHWILVSKYLYSPATEFNATLNGVTGTYRTPATGFLGDHGSLSTNRTYVALRVA